MTEVTTAPSDDAEVIVSIDAAPFVREGETLIPARRALVQAVEATPMPARQGMVSVDGVWLALPQSAGFSPHGL